MPNGQFLATLSFFVRHGVVGHAGRLADLGLTWIMRVFGIWGLSQRNGPGVRLSVPC